MDRGLLGQEASLEAARELLIAISNSQPEKVESDQVESSNSWESRTVINGDRTEIFRSRLISISYPQPPNDRRLCNGHA
nr:uncharacterized protein LOC100241958 [Ipomoea trifida]GMD74786.1 uncharacterized protein LOC100241958 [Ipomoea batatas]GMD76799.1 uncharacterized protein LOC100241958 [Ipomoea batatas]GMD78284.1 uncharacterized protein LOC100241958 [Ipomoea batatas]GMD79413.1 uncharacterized protein LOC100241958 [Ipomoea batatas]